ncbi:hypothetical protein F0562_009240 [Nyssa sinensis]|uniref:Uncharacterized protein n=1 Tax=Nyssa sinensis TaxID=561372 RepID=A0A5J5A0D6_9ASTE|nr:hypothetical protein F0562_009240 [Nyssa sinensis]
MFLMESLLVDHITNGSFNYIAEEFPLIESVCSNHHFWLSLKSIITAQFRSMRIAPAFDGMKGKKGLSFLLVLILYKFKKS